MRFLEIFNRYEHAGGEEAAAAQIFEMIADQPEFEMSRAVAASGDWMGSGAPARWKQALWSFSNPQFRAELRKAQAAVGADAWIAHNVFPVVSAGVYAEALELGVPIIQFVHNWRPFAINGSNFINGHVPKGSLRAHLCREVRAANWRGSRSQTLLLGLVLLWLRRSGWLRAVRAWVAVSGFARDRLVEAGLPRDKVYALRHCWRPIPLRVGSEDRGHYLFLGRLIPEKGIDVLLACWDVLRRILGEKTPKLVIGGAGPAASKVASAAATNPSIRFPGVVGGLEKDVLLGGCRALVVPSIWWEPLGLVVYEAYEHAKPVLAAASGGLAETVIDGQTGLLHRPGDADGLAAHVIRLERQEELRSRMGLAGRRWLEENASPEKWLASFRDIARQVAGRGRD